MTVPYKPNRVECPKCSWYGCESYLNSHYCIPLGSAPPRYYYQPMNITQEAQDSQDINIPDGYGGCNSTTIPAHPPEPETTLESATIEQLVDELKDRGAKEVTLKF